ncbi:disease resistance protein RPP8-like [Chenopodium quinoa]|uniref:disease resistance protein RPP8-like n=1 Tax=Chenopodium quinoa TaxID=63459 RepID=UPI000B781E5B|nr:disease resistance protein RPP8-like [Chenopodium quinoa]
MLKFCQGIPLAIIALGGLLVTKKTPEEWETLLGFMSSHENGKNNQQQSYEKVMEICYYALPYYLKNCLLHLGGFPKDFEVPNKKLCNMWVAEGIAVLANGEVSRGESLDDFAENCLSELMQRGLVQVWKRKTSNGSVKSCKLHALMRELCLRVFKDENFLSILDFDSKELVLNGKTRRLAIYLGQEGKDQIVLPQKNPVLRSLLLFPSQKERPEVNHASVKVLCRESQLIRVLDLEGVVVSSKTLPKEIGDFIFLRYLSLRDMLLTKIPPTIGCLRWLETLDLRAKVRLEIPNVLWCLERLRNLYLPCYFTIKDSEKLRLDNLKNLLTLKNVNHFLLEDVLSMKKLRKASVRYMLENEHIEFIQKSPKVVFSLTIFRAIIGKEHVNALISFANLIKLELKGEVSVPIHDLKFPPNLKKLVLDFCGIMQDPMPVLEKLPNLTSLCLDHQAYVGQKMICSASGFPQLTYLRLHGLKSLHELNVEHGAMPNLKYLEVRICERLTKIPEDLPEQVQITHI